MAAQNDPVDAPYIDELVDMVVASEQPKKRHKKGSNKGSKNVKKRIARGAQYTPIGTNNVHTMQVKSTQNRRDEDGNVMYYAVNTVYEGSRVHYECDCGTQMSKLKGFADPGPRGNCVHCTSVLVQHLRGYLGAFPEPATKLGKRRREDADDAVDQVGKADLDDITNLLDSLKITITSKLRK